MRSSEDIGKLVLRIVIGGLMLLHGISKPRHGVGGIEGMLSSKGLPGFIAYGVYVGEVIAPLAIMAGVFTRAAALVFAFNMLVAVGMAHAGDVFELGKQGGWKIELQGLYFFGSVVIALIGPGRFALRRRTGWQS